MPFIKIVVLVWNIVYEYIIDSHIRILCIHKLFIFINLCKMHEPILGQLLTGKKFPVFTTII